MTYSVAIRTLGKSPETLQRELESISRQTIMPDKVIIYIAEGYPKPSFHVMGEIYVETKKGMSTQRALDYAEIQSDCILLLDDDVELSSNTAKTLLKQLKDNNADCVAADTFKNYKMSFSSKMRAALGNLVFPYFGQKWAFKIRSCGSFSYINNPKYDCYPSQSAAGPASLWRKDAILKLDFKTETWIDDLGFPYGEDELFFYKLYINGGKLMVSFNSAIENLDGKTSSGDFQKDSRKSYTRSKSNFIRWHRMIFRTRNSSISRASALLCFSVKQLWITGIHICLSVSGLNLSPLKWHVKGLIDGCKHLKTEEYKKLSNFKTS